MSLTDTYASLEELRERFEIDEVGGEDDTRDDAAMERALVAATAWINEYCGRNFNDAETAAQRVYRPLSRATCFVDDLHTTDDLVVSVNGSELSDDSYLLEPLDGVVIGTPRWPYTKVVLTDNSFTVSRAATVSVTARWGWAEVPSPVKEACLIAASELFKLKDSPFGVAGGDEFGIVRIGKHSPRVMAQLNLYRRRGVKTRVDYGLNPKRH